jgi:RNase P/RNase MRP subunit POP5
VQLPTLGGIIEVDRRRCDVPRQDVMTDREYWLERAVAQMDRACGSLRKAGEIALLQQLADIQAQAEAGVTERPIPAP